MIRLTCRFPIIAIFVLILAVRAHAQSGKVDYDRYCATCHGFDGRGNGSWNGSKVPDLTHLKLQNGGKFPSEEIRNVVDGRSRSQWHQRRGSMPFWGEVFEAEHEN